MFSPAGIAALDVSLAAKRDENRPWTKLMESQVNAMKGVELKAPIDKINTTDRPKPRLKKGGNVAVQKSNVWQYIQRMDTSQPDGGGEARHVDVVDSVADAAAVEATLQFSTARTNEGTKNMDESHVPAGITLMSRMFSRDPSKGRNFACSLRAWRNFKTNGWNQRR